MQAVELSLSMQWAGAERDPLGEAMDAWTAGDERAFETVYRLLSSRMWAFAVRLCRAQSDAEDLFQEAWSKMHRARATYARGTSPLCWCFAVLRSTHIDSLRRKKRRIETQDGAEIDDVSAGDAHSPEAAANARQTLDRFERALSALPAIHREAWVLTHEQGLSIADAAAVLGTTGTAVKLRVHRAASALREALGVTANG